LTPTLRSREEVARASRRAGPFRLARQEAAGLVTSFNYAFEGIIYVVRTQRNMRWHFVAALAVLPLGVVLGVTRFELLALLLSVSFVLIAEMLNTVLVAAVNAVFVGYLVFAERLRDPSRRAIDTVKHSPVHLTVIALALVILLVIVLKARTAHGTPLYGGLPSGHAAVAYGGWVAITFAVADYRHAVLVSTLVFVMATLVAQTRVEAGVHTTTEVVLGGLLGATVTAAVFQVFS